MQRQGTSYLALTLRMPAYTAKATLPAVRRTMHIACGHLQRAQETTTRQYSNPGTSFHARYFLRDANGRFGRFGWRNIRMIAFLNPEGFESAQMLSISGAPLPVRERCCASQVPSLVSHAHVTTSSSEPHRVQKVSDVCTRSDKISL